MVKPRAARKKPIVLSSDSEDAATRSPPRNKRSLASRSSRAGRDIQPARTQTQRAVSPRPSRAAAKRSPAKSPAKLQQTSKPITSFFSNVPRAQSAHPTPSPEKPAASLEDIDDILDSSDDDRSQKPSTALPVRKRLNESSTTETDRLASGRQKFLRTATGARSTPPPSQFSRSIVEDKRPWTETFGPASLDELAVHKKKVADVRQWLTDVLGGRDRKRLLLLKGPAGSGKTTTMSLLSKELDIDIHEWKNPIGSLSSSEHAMSATAQFEDFVGRTGVFGTLSFQGHSEERQRAVPDNQIGRHKQLILVEEFPNTFTRTSSAVQSFRSSILSFLAAHTQSATRFFSTQVETAQPVTPLVMIISETLLSTNTAAADSFTAHRLLGPEILTHPGVTVIEFNPIAPTYMMKALEAIVLKEARKSGRRKTLGPQVIQRLAEIGDIRSAVSSLEFLCLRGDEVDDWSGKINFAKKKGSKDVAMTKMEQESLEMVTQRESTLGIFHAVGRVVYNKRLPEDPEAFVAQPPNWFPERRRPKASEVDTDTLFDELGTDTQTFVAALHENYVLSCGGADSEETMDSIEGCIEALSDADILSPDRFGAGSGRRVLQGTSTDNLRQDEMCYQTSVRGLLYHLPNPVKRLAPPPGVTGTRSKSQGTSAGMPKGNAFVMYYPASLRIWKQQEEIGDLLDMWVSRAQRGDLLALSAGMKPPLTPAGGVESWKKNTSFTPPTRTQTTESNENSHSPVLLGSGGSARSEMLLERLPYLTTILRNTRGSATAAMTIRDIQKITSFGSTSTMGMEEDGDEDEDEDDLAQRRAGEQEQWTTDKPAAETPKKNRRVKFGAVEQEQDSALPGLVDKSANLMLSDDDIED
ncbi:RFC checkpoint protein Rad17 [Coniothyrium glycines]